jgi:hypothetical protein
MMAGADARLADLLAGRIPPGIYQFASRARPATIAKQAAPGGWRFFYLDGRQIASKSDFLQACVASLGLPDYFGNNWDALEDSLRDLAWAPARNGYLVLYDHVGRFACGQPEAFAVALAILRESVATWRATSTPMAVLLRDAACAASEAPEL